MNNTDRFSTPMEMTLKKTVKKILCQANKNMGPESDRVLVRESSNIGGRDLKKIMNKPCRGNSQFRSEGTLGHYHIYATGGWGDV